MICTNINIHSLAALESLLSDLERGRGGEHEGEVGDEGFNEQGIKFGLRTGVGEQQQQGKVLVKVLIEEGLVFKHLLEIITHCIFPKVDNVKTVQKTN